MQNPEGKGKVIERALNDEETHALENAPQIAAAKDLADKDPERALRIAMRQEQPPKGMLPTFAYFELERRALADGDHELLDKLRTSPLAKEVTTAGRLSQSFATRDPVAATVDAKIQEITSALENQAKGSHETIEQARDTVVAKAEKDIAREVKAQVRNRKNPMADLADYIKSIECR